jgi:hypothetical protein
MRTPFFLAAVLVAGCATAPATPDAGVTATGNLAIKGADGRQLLTSTAVLPWVKADIDKVELTLLAGTTAVATNTIAKADLNKQVRFTNLVRNTSYHVVAKAWAAGDVQIDNFDTDNASCTTDFSTTNEAQVSTGAIKLTLRNKTFAGTGNSTGLTVTDGTVTDTTASQGIELVQPD